MRKLALATLALTVSLSAPAVSAKEGSKIEGPIVSAPQSPRLSAPLRGMPWTEEAEKEEKAKDRHNPLAAEPDQGRRGTWGREAVPRDPLAERSVSGTATPSPLFTFEGTGNPTGCSGCSPPDTVGDIGPNHYVQIVNATKVTVFSPDGATIEGPYDLGLLWSSGNCTANAGDPIVNYDPLADRWVLSQFASPSHLCFAVSTTNDPADTYHVYTFNVGSFPDYFKVGVWPDGYYVAANESSYTAMAFEREAMLAGLAAQQVKFTGGDNLFLPADLDGVKPPPPGSPGHFYSYFDNTFHGGADRIEVWDLSVDWNAPGSATFTLAATLPTIAFTYTVCGFFNFDCARQSGTPQRVDTVSEWPMFRFAYRNRGAFESFVGNFAVGGAVNGPGGTGEVGGAPRWFEVRKSGSAWGLFQEGTYDPADGHDRFMGSAAMDGAGSIALGYSVSSSAMFPAVRYALRADADPLGTLGSEATLINGSGSQTASNRWGDYSAMSVSPADDCTFYYTNQYYPASSGSTWKTRVGAFRAPGCATLFFDDFETGAIGRWDLFGTEEKR